MTCIDLHFRPWITRICMSQVFNHHILISKTNYFLIFFFNQKWWGRAEKCINARLCMSQVFIHHILISKTKYFLNFFFQSKMMTKSWKMHKRAFLHFSGLHPPYFDLQKPIISWTDFVSKYGEVRSVTCIDVHFRPWNTPLCLSQVFIHHILN